MKWIIIAWNTIWKSTKNQQPVRWPRVSLLAQFCKILYSTLIDNITLHENQCFFVYNLYACIKAIQILQLIFKFFRWNCVISDLHESSERRGSGSRSWGPRPTWPRRCWGTRATTGPWTCGAPGSSSTSHFPEHFPSTRTRTSMNRSKTHPSCILLIHGRIFQRTP